MFVANNAFAATINFTWSGQDNTYVGANLPSGTWYMQCNSWSGGVGINDFDLDSGSSNIINSLGDSIYSFSSGDTSHFGIVDSNFFPTLCNDSVNLTLMDFNPSGSTTIASTTCNSSSTLLDASGTGNMINCINTTWYSYFLTLLEHYWPYVVGVGILLIAWMFARHAINALQ